MEELLLSKRAYNVLKQCESSTIQQLVACEEIVKFFCPSNCCKKTINCIQVALVILTVLKNGYAGKFFKKLRHRKLLKTTNSIAILLYKH